MCLPLSRMCHEGVNSNGWDICHLVMHPKYRGLSLYDITALATVTLMRIQDARLFMPAKEGTYYTSISWTYIALRDENIWGFYCINICKNVTRDSNNVFKIAACIMTDWDQWIKVCKNLRLRICNGTILDENWRCTPLRKVGIYLPNYTALHTGRQ